MTTVWINGKADTRIEVSDRALAYGDGFFTTMSIKQGKVELWALHKKRILLSLSKLSFPSVDILELESELFSLTKQKEQGVIKLIISRGSGGRAYDFSGCNKPMRIVFWLPEPKHYQALRLSGIDLMLCKTPISGIPQLAGLKTLNRIEQVLIKQELEQNNFVEGAVCDLNGKLIECCSANIFWRKAEQVFTPDLSICGVNGVMRQKVIELLQALNYKVSEVLEPAECLLQADEVFITNSLMPILPVKNYNGHRFSDFSLSQQLIELNKDMHV